MKELKVKIEGIGPGLLQYCPYNFLKAGNRKGAISCGEKINVLKFCKERLYINKDGSIYQPGSHILHALIQAGKKFLFKKKLTFAPVIERNVLITPENIPHLNKKWVVFHRSLFSCKPEFRWKVVKPLLPKWALEFEIIYDEEKISKGKVREILAYAGKHIGLGDWRPRVHGVFGKFRVSQFKEGRL